MDLCERWIVLLLFSTVSLCRSTLSHADVKYRCPNTLTVANARLRDGLKAGTFTQLAPSAKNELCIERCCESVTCDLLAWIGDHCYGVTCYSEEQCRPEQLRATERGATLLYIVSRKEGHRRSLPSPHSEPSTRVRRSVGSQKSNAAAYNLQNVPKNTARTKKTGATLVSEGDEGKNAAELEVAHWGFLSGDSDFTSGSASEPSLMLEADKDLGESSSSGSFEDAVSSSVTSASSGLTLQGGIRSKDVETVASDTGSDVTNVGSSTAHGTTGSVNNAVSGLRVYHSGNGKGEPRGAGPFEVQGENEDGSQKLKTQNHPQVKTKEKVTKESPEDASAWVPLESLRKAGVKTEDTWLNQLAMKVYRYGHPRHSELKIQFESGNDNTNRSAQLITHIKTNETLKSQRYKQKQLEKSSGNTTSLAGPGARTSGAEMPRKVQNSKVENGKVSNVKLQSSSARFGLLSRTRQRATHMPKQVNAPQHGHLSKQAKPVKLESSSPQPKHLTKQVNLVKPESALPKPGHLSKKVKPESSSPQPKHLTKQVNLVKPDSVSPQPGHLSKQVKPESSSPQPKHLTKQVNLVKPESASPQPGHLSKQVKPESSSPQPGGNFTKEESSNKAAREHLKHALSQKDLKRLSSFVDQVNKIYMDSHRTRHGENPAITRANELKLIEKAAQMMSPQARYNAMAQDNQVLGRAQASLTGVAKMPLADRLQLMAPQGFFKDHSSNAASTYKPDPLYQALSKIRFGNKPSTVRNSSRFDYLQQCGLYVEEYNVTRTAGSWNTHVFEPYSYLYEMPEHYSQCKTEAWLNHTDMRGSVFLSFQVKSIMGNTMYNNARVCATYCCKEPRCRAWTLRLQQAPTKNCNKGSFCCWLKSAIPTLSPGVSNVTSGIVERENSRDPPIGMRSSVPLGGLATGSFELRADGTFHEWTIENQSPGGSAKLNKGALDLAVLGVRVARGNQSAAVLLRTHAPQGYRGVKALHYSGSYPVSKLTVDDEITEDVGMDLYAYPAFHPRDPYKSAVPAVAFTLALENKGKEPVNASFLLNIPLGFQEDTLRVGDNYGEVVFTRKIGPSDCSRSCDRMPRCMAWTTNGPSSCLLKNKMPLHAWAHGIASGVKGHWSLDKSRDMLTLERPGFYPQSGSTTFHPVGGADRDVSFGVAYEFEEIWKNFTEKGLAGQPNTSLRGLHGAASVSSTLAPGQKKTLTIILSWFYPNRDQAKVRIGNFYSNFLKSSRGGAAIMRKDLLHAVESVHEWQAPLLTSPSISLEDKTTHSLSKINRLPVWLQDMLANSVSFWRSAFWTEDGRFRQWEAYDCNDINTIQSDMQRIMPYILFYPEVVRHLLLSWASNQFSSGRLQEALTEGCLGQTGKLDYAGGRVMADSTALFVVEVYHYYTWTGDESLLHKLWPHTKRAVTWLIGENTKGTGLPFRKATAYDLAGLDKYDHDIYESVIYLLALRVAQHLAIKMKDKTLNATVTAAQARARWHVTRELWDERRQYYRAWWDAEYGASDWLMSDSLYGQVWAYTLGLGELLPNQKMQMHLENEIKHNDSPYGLRVISTDDPVMSIEDTALVLSSKLPGCSSLENITKHNSVWMGANANWASLSLNLGVNPELCLKQAEKALDHWRSTLKDQWNIHGLISSNGYGQDGLPWATSHYNSHLVMWHIPFALSGQQYSALERTLTFWPKFDIPFELPFFTPTASGLIEGSYTGSGSDIEEMFTLKVTSGSIRLTKLAILGSNYGDGKILLKKDSVVKWSRPKSSIASILSELKD